MLPPYRSWSSLVLMPPPSWEPHHVLIMRRSLCMFSFGKHGGVTAPCGIRQGGLSCWARGLACPLPCPVDAVGAGGGGVQVNLVGCPSLGMTPTLCICYQDASGNIVQLYLAWANAHWTGRCVCGGGLLSQPQPRHTHLAFDTTKNVRKGLWN